MMMMMWRRRKIENVVGLFPIGKYMASIATTLLVY
jgi:hypothetical protein